MENLLPGQFGILINPKDLSIIERSISDLHTNVVIVGLNISQALADDWLNYHTEGHDRKLRYAFNRSPYRGAYMTDIIKRVEVKSRNIQNEIKFGTLNLDSHLNNFREEMRIVGANKKSLFILLGNLAYDLFNKELKSDFPNRVLCYHCSYYGLTDAAWVEKTWKTLSLYPRDSNQLFPRFTISQEMQDQIKNSNKNKAVSEK